MQDKIAIQLFFLRFRVSEKELSSRGSKSYLDLVNIRFCINWYVTSLPISFFLSYCDWRQLNKTTFIFTKTLLLAMKRKVCCTDGLRVVRKMSGVFSVNKDLWQVSWPYLKSRGDFKSPRLFK